MPPSRDLQNLLGAVEHVLRGAQRASRQDPNQGMVTLIHSISDALETAARGNTAGPAAGQGAPPPSSSPREPAPSTDAVAEELVQRAFRGALGRPPRPDELRDFTARMAGPLKRGGAADADVLSMLARALEHHPEVRARHAQAPPRTPPRAAGAPAQAAEAPGTGRRINIRRRDT